MADLTEWPHLADILVLGGGAAGSVLAARLSEDPGCSVVLVEAGPDITEADMPPEIRAPYPSRAFFTRDYFHPELYALLGDVPGISRPGRSPARYEQARVLGGGSTINGLVGNRGAPSDYDGWAEWGIGGWSWSDVLPYFRKLETDQDFDGPYHGKDGPVSIRRLQDGQRSGFIERAFTVMQARGFERIEDQNGPWRDGAMPPAVTLTAQGTRASAATAYLTPSVRARPNLVILTGAEALRVTFAQGRANGADIRMHGTIRHIAARQVVVSCGAIHSPTLLLRSGIGPATALQPLGISMQADLRGVGRNLHEHPALGISCFVRPGHRAPGDRHHTQLHLRFSSALEDCPSGDMMMALLARSAWHAVGGQLATFYLWVNKPYSEGVVELNSPDPAAAPMIDFRLLSDPRDLTRMRNAFHFIAGLARDPAFDAVRHEVFPTIYSDRVRKVSRPTRFNAIQTRILAGLLDAAGFARAGLIRRLIAPVGLEDLLADDQALTDYLHRAVVGVWHPTGTCRMGRSDDPFAVTDSAGRVHGVPGLRVCDASLMPDAVSANTNLPTIMMAERIADLIKAGT